jgi:plasmid maintenance system antidote protein VapI
MNKFDYYKYLDSQLRNLILAPGEWLTQDEFKEVSDFIDVGEYGVAFETLCSLLVEENKGITQEKYQKIAELGKVMGIEEDTWLQLKPLIT